VAHYPRAVVIENATHTESGVVELTDRTDYSAYSERCWPSTVTKGDLLTKQLVDMNLREFSETINFRWVLNKSYKNSESDKRAKNRRSTDAASDVENTDCEADDERENVDENVDVECDDTPLPEELSNDTTDDTSGRKSRLNWRCRDRTSGHWIMWRKRKPTHVRSSTVLYTDLARHYVPSDEAKKFFDLPFDKRNQLKRAYQEIVFYLPWQDDPDKTFLTEDVIRELKDESTDPDSGSRYSLKRMHEYFKVYMTKWHEGIVAPPGSQWHRDNQYSYTMYLATQHNRVIQDDRVSNDGILIARLESVDDADQGTQIEIQPRLATAGDDDQYPSASNFLPSDVLEEVQHQLPPTMADLYVAYPDNENWKELKNAVSKTSENLFMAKPPKPEVDLADLTAMQRHAYDLIANGLEKIIFIHAKAGCGKTLVALHLCEKFANRVQASCNTGKGASNFNGPTIHGAFLWGAKGTCYASAMSPAKKQKLQNFYKDTDLFIFDEINACSADMLCQIDETMRELFSPVNPTNGKRLDRPFGGKTVVFMGDSAQLRPIRAAAIYDTCVNSAVLKYKSAASKEYFKNAQKGQQIYRQYLVPKCIFLERGQRNLGLLQQLMDRMRRGEQTERDLDKLTFQRNKHPDYIAQRGIHYSNESASLFNCRQLWDDCKLLGRHLFVCRALYHVDDGNENVVRILSGIPASDFGYAPDVLCLAEGCEVRLITNLDTSAGLVTNSTGNVVRIIYDNADAEAVTKGDYPPAYCIIVHFSSFQGFVSQSSPNDRYYPFTNQKLVPIYRRRFTLEKIPESIRKVQARKFCYREQFPIDLSTNLTAHRGQGQTWKNCTLSVNLGFESPQNNLPTDAASIAYVACTRINRLKDLFLSPIFPSVWLEMGKSERDIARRKHEEALKKAAKEFASLTGKYDECIAELNFKEDYSNTEQEWREIVSGTASAGLKSCPTLMADDDLNAMKQSLSDEKSPISLKAAMRERFIGIDQGIKTFSMVATDKSPDNLPKVVGIAQLNLEQVGLLDGNGRFTETDVLLKLEQFSPLFQWITGADQQETSDEEMTQLQVVDRVVVAVEQISIENAYHKQLGQNLAVALQRMFDINKCVVKMSSPHLHRKNGPMFRLGDDIVEACKLEPPSYENLQTRIERKRHMNAGTNGGSRKRCRRHVTQDDDVEPSDDSMTANEQEGDETELDVNTYQSIRRQVQNQEYRKKKAMSAAIFKYFTNATPAQQLVMQVEIDPELQTVWQNASAIFKYDDLGDALLHSLDAAICQASKYRQLIPSSPTLHKNRTVVVVLLPNKAFWVVIECLWNRFTVQDMGIYATNLMNRTFSGQETIDGIVARLHPRLLKAMSEFDTSLDCLSATGYIKIIVKQLKSYGRMDMSPKAAGALTNSTVKAFTNICDAACSNSTLSVSQSKKSGWLYSRTCKESGKRIDVLRSSGKHLNAILSCLQWMKSNLPDFVRDRPLRIDGPGRCKFFQALKDVAFELRYVK
jgi:hypothetical protein